MLMAKTYFPYGDAEIAYLEARDKTLATIIEQIGHVHRAMDDDLFCAVVHHIIGQQVSTAAQETVWKRVQDGLGKVDAGTVASTSVDELQAFGTTFRKAGYVLEFAQKVNSGDFDLEAVHSMPDAEAVSFLSSLRGVGEWTAEMVLLFGLGRSDILSFKDLAIHRGMRMVYRHRKITRELFEIYRRRFRPNGSVASLYFWEVSRDGVRVPPRGPRRDHRPRRNPAVGPV